MITKSDLKDLKRKIEKRFLNKDFTRVADLKDYNLVPSANPKVRINLMITSLRAKDVYAGIKSALDFFLKFSKYDVDLRILVMGQEVKVNQLYSIPGFSIVTNQKDALGNTIVDISKNLSTFTIRENDYFLGTMWFTIYNANKFLDQQAELFGERKSLIYLVQDYEPGFYQWSSNYLLSESTYTIEDQIVVFNSKYLRDNVLSRGYQFKESYYFDPILNEKLKEVLLKVSEPPVRKNRILLYGRPGKPRNAFELICMGLREWKRMTPDFADWEIFSAGEDMNDLVLEDGLVVQSLGKMSIEDYAKFMLESKVGISLMVSPHPSYPPLEMATFGMQVLANSFETKDISDFNENIHSVDHIDIRKFAEELHELTSGSFDYKIDQESDYVHGISQIDSIVDAIAGTLLG